MKELSIEEKNYNGNYKVYTELINRLEDVKEAIKKQNYGIAMDILCKSYPEFQITTSTELTESEDEKIRKWIIAYLEYMVMNTSITDEKDNCLNAIRWLEKQNEQRPACAWSEEDEKMLNDIVKDLVHPWNEYIPDRIEDEIKWLKNRLKSLRPQKHWKPTESQIASIKQAVVNMKSSACYDSELVSLYNDLKSLD